MYILAGRFRGILVYPSLERKPPAEGGKEGSGDPPRREA